jgi:RimJ/RimL family protein N-acetyltransferase
MQKINFRQLASADHNEYRRIRLSCLVQYPDNFGTTFDEELNASSLRLTNAVQSPDKNNFAYGAFTVNEQLIGICGFISEKRVKVQHRGEVVQLFVDKQYAGKQIGKTLLQLTIDKAFENEQKELISLSVVSINEKAIQLYKKLGFVEYGRLDGYFKSGSQYFTQVFFMLTRILAAGVMNSER